MKREKTLTMDERGRITLPASIRKKINARKFEVVLTDEGILLKPVRNDALDKYFGIFKGRVKKDVDEILDEAMEEYVREYEKVF
ncbi:hypothetical protein L3N51_01277 [Metallosphaera sp. J1]|uniref:AbrB/MazE/SpoVT family DNA-binding domain-containing protein n=1 Tax=Metallosphaera javensis (ex Hofmann et al. 2022) TaxID=99938 RepID=UPI001EE0B233|nr:AbrB/MazE/SpoVT family DNA-binding domain-containing protein [Metallosphaera javensis (ex Hofmann et al. 2022)]MCG3108987.1 hypothetical protein [Metallosphaera javensis (ex Hofmann et al. 2022)]